MANVFGEAYVYDDGYVCVNSGYQLQDVLLTVETANTFMNCYKTIIQSLGDWSQWTKTTGPFFDECDQSESVDVTLYKWNPITQDQITYWSGTNEYPSTSAIQKKCWPGKLSFLGQYIYNQLNEKYPEKVAEFEAKQKQKKSEWNL